MIEFVSDDIWRRITAKVKRRRSRCFAAIAYFGTGGAARLPLSQGSVLVVDASEHVVRAGQTDPEELLILIEKGVSVHSVRNLHAKVVVVGDEAFVGSMNVSNRSANVLREAAVRTTNRTIVKAARAMVRDLANVAAMGPEHAKQLMKIYSPPRVPAAANTRMSEHEPVWIARTKLAEWDDEDWSARKRGLPTARKHLTKGFVVDQFSWDSRGLRALKRGDQIICINEVAASRELVTPPARVIHVQPYARGTRRIVFFEVARPIRRKSLKRIRDRKVRNFLDHSNGRRVPNALIRDILAACGAR